MPPVTPVLNTPIWCDHQSPNPAAARDFYASLLGWAYEVGAPETGYYASARLGEALAAGIGGQAPDYTGPSTWTLYFGVASADDTVAAVVAHGGSVIIPPMSVMEFGRMAICVDPGGAVFGLWQPGTHKGRGIADEPGAMCWSEVLTRAPEATHSFYRDVFGLTVQAMAGMEYWTLHHGEPPVAGVWKMEDSIPAQVPSHWMIYFAVKDVDEAVRTATAQGATVRAQPWDTPYGRIAVLSDPFGAPLALLQAPQRA